MKQYASENVTFSARVLSLLNGTGIHMRLLLSSFGIGMALLALSFEAGAADANAIYDLPSGVTPYIIDDADVMTISIQTPNEMKFLYDVDKDGHVKKGSNGNPVKALDWYDVLWATTYYFPVPVSDSREGTNVAASAYNGSLLGPLPSSWDTSTYDYLLATRIDNLQFLGDRYPYDYSSGIHVAQLSRQFEGVKGKGQSLVYEPLNLVTGNPFLTNRTNKILHRDHEPFTVQASSMSAQGPIKGDVVKGRTQTGFGYDAVDGNMDTYWSSGNEQTSTLTIDFKEEREIEKIIIRWRGYNPHLYRLKLADDDGLRFQSMYIGTVNPTNEAADNNQIPAAAATWEKVNSNYYRNPDTSEITEDVVEVFRPKDGGTEKARYVRFEGIQQGQGTKGQGYEILEFEVYAYDPTQSQVGGGRLFTFNDKLYLLFDNTGNGKMDDPEEEGGNGRRAFIVEVRDSNTAITTETLQRVVVPYHYADSRTLIRLNRPVISASQADELGISRTRLFEERNLTPFEGRGDHAGKLMMIYGYDPLEVYEVDTKTGDMVLVPNVLSSRAASLWGNGGLGSIQGGTPAIWVDALDGYLTFFHSSTEKRMLKPAGSRDVSVYGETSYLGALLIKWDDAFSGYRIMKITSEPLVHASWYDAYSSEDRRGPTADGVAQDDDYYYVSLGISDRQNSITTLSKANLHAQLISSFSDPEIEQADLLWAYQDGPNIGLNVTADSSTNIYWTVSPMAPEGSVNSWGLLSDPTSTNVTNAVWGTHTWFHPGSLSGFCTVTANAGTNANSIYIMGMDCSPLKLEPITTRMGPDGLLYNPSGMAVGSTAQFEVIVDDCASSSNAQITWTNNYGSVSFPNGNTGAIVTVRMDGKGTAQLRVDVADDLHTNATIEVEGLKPVTNKLYAFIIAKDNGKNPATSKSEITNLLAGVNRIYTQAAMTFELAAVKYIRRTEWMNIESGSKNEKDLVSYRSGTGGVEVYFVESIAGPTLGEFVPDVDIKYGPALPWNWKTSGIIIQGNTTAGILAHEIGHACGLEDTYASHGTNSISAQALVREAWAPDDWNSGPGPLYYAPDLSQKELLSTRLLMYGYGYHTNTIVIPRGRVYGVTYDSYDVPVYKVFHTRVVHSPDRLIKVGLSDMNRKPMSR